MPKNPIKKVPISKEATMKLLKHFNISIKKLATYPELNINEKTLRRALNSGEINPKYMEALSNIFGMPEVAFMSVNKAIDYIDSLEWTQMEAVVYVPETGEILYMFEGDGMNLLQEDIDEGYVDYIYLNTYHMIGCDMNEYDGGMYLLEEPFAEKFKTEDEMIKYTIEAHYGCKLDYIRLKDWSTEWTKD